jgi:hypothetical protein
VRPFTVAAPLETRFAGADAEWGSGGARSATSLVRSARRVTRGPVNSPSIRKVSPPLRTTPLAVPVAATKSPLSATRISIEFPKCLAP